MKNVLPLEKFRRLYMRNLNDLDISQKVLCDIQEIRAWRKKENLPSNDHIKRIESRFIVKELSEPDYT